jgi:hypothetical protein
MIERTDKLSCAAGSATGSAESAPIIRPIFVAGARSELS